MDLSPATHAGDVAVTALSNLEGVLAEVPADGWYDHLHTLNLLRYQLEEITRTSVHQARGAGLTWEQVGTGLGTTKQAVQQRFGGAK
jgi:hypothetical protein